MSVVDRMTEAAGRWLAARTTRRSFLGWMGRAAMVTAGGTALAGVLQRQAEARVCGQSGVSPKCPTYDCHPPDVWGWCWYASPGCCANGGLKKICDCCRANHPNVQGYCPAGTTVYCIVESCLEDPRVTTVAVDRFNGPTAAEVSLQRLRARPNGSAATVVVGDASDPRAAAMAAPVAGLLDAPLLLLDPLGPPDAALVELQRLGTRRVTVVGPGVLGLTGRLAQVVPSVDAAHDPLDLASASVAVANWVLALGGGRRLWVIGAGGVASDSAAAAGALAMAERAPVVIGIDACNAVRNGAYGPGLSVVFVGPEPTAVADPGGDTVPGDTAVAVVDALARRALAQAGTGRTALSFAPARTPAIGAALMSPGGAFVLHDDGVVSAALRDWCSSVRRSVGRAEVATGVPGSLPDQGVYDLQSALNGYDAHLLMGVAGQGLPVYPQPMDERVQGRARVSGPLPSTTTTTTTTLVGRANPLRQAGPTTTSVPGAPGAPGRNAVPTATTRPATRRVPVAAPTKRTATGQTPPRATTTTRPTKPAKK